MSHKPETWILDIETSPMLAYVFGLKDQNIALNQLKEDWHIMAWSAKPLGGPKSSIIYYETRNGDDRAIVKALWHLLDKVDILITQNGKGFDGPRIEARMMLHGMKPPSPYKHLDTYLSTRPRGFTSHKLEYLTGKFCKTNKKVSHSKFPGMKLWTECLKGNPKAWKEMRIYNIKDVLATEELYLKTQAWTPKGMPSPYVPVDAAPNCPTCHSYNLRSLGIEKNGLGKHRRYICTQCGDASIKGEYYK